MTTTSQLLDQFGMNYQVEKQQLILPSGKLSNAFATVRTDTDTHFGTFTDSYEVYQNYELMELASNIASETGYDIKEGGTFRTGGRVRINLRAENSILEYKNVGDIIERGFDLTNTFDGSRPLSMSIRNKVLSCTNGMTRWVDGIKYNFRHSRNMRSLVNQSLEMLAALRIEEELMYTNINRMIEVKAKPQNVVDMVEFITKLKMSDIVKKGNNFETTQGISTRAKNEALTLLDCIYKEMGLRESDSHTPKGDNIWGLLSGVTYYTEHLAGSNARRAENKLFGRANVVDNQAYELALATL